MRGQCRKTNVAPTVAAVRLNALQTSNTSIWAGARPAPQPYCQVTTLIIWFETLRNEPREQRKQSLVLRPLLLCQELHETEIGRFPSGSFVWFVADKGPRLGNVSPMNQRSPLELSCKSSVGAVMAGLCFL